MTIPLFLHLTALGFWLGLVVVESIMELQKSTAPEYRFQIAKVHRQIDMFAEIPAFTLVLVTGLIMLDPARMHGWYLIKIVCGSIVVAINAWCAVYVFRRHVAAKAGNGDEVNRYTRLIMVTVPIGTPFAVAALWIGLSWLLV